MKKCFFTLSFISCVVMTAMPQSPTWLTTGNAGLSGSANFIGTTDNVPFVIKVNNYKSGIIAQTTTNTSFGFKTLLATTTGSDNTAVGFGALTSNTTGSWNLGIGSNALLFATAATENIAIGNSASQQISDATNTIALGHRALMNNTASQNVAIGNSALRSTVIGNYNVAVGNYALYNNTNQFNTAVGQSALIINTSGYSNTAVGYSALSNNSTGYLNTAIGYNAGTSESFNNTISIGNNGWANAYHNQAFIGNASTAWIGGWRSWSVYSDARMKTNISENVKGLDFITRLRPVTYYTNIKLASKISGDKETEDYPQKHDADKIQYSGFLAQEVEKAANDAGYNFSGITKPRTKNDLYSLSYESFVVPLVKAVQEQQVIIEKQQAIGDEQQELIKQLQQRLETMERKINALVLSQNSYEKNKFSLSPNPAGNYVVLNCADTKDPAKSLILYNNTGAAIWKQDGLAIAGNSIRIPMQQFPSGLYHLAVQDNEGWQTLKLIKQ